MIGSSLTRLLGSILINPKDIGVNDPVTNGTTALAGVFTTIYFWAGVIAIAIMITGGYLYTTSNANAQRMQRARDTIQYGAVGLVIILSAFTITQYVLGRF